MRPLDWVVLASWLVLLIGFGLWRARGSSTVNQYLLAGKTMPWYAMGLSIMATQAGALTFISTTGQGYADGMRFVQFYFGLPIAMVIICATAAPIFHRAKVYTAYEYLEKRFDAKTRALVTAVFLIERGLSAGIALAAPAIVLSVILKMPFTLTTVIMGAIIVIFTTFGGIKAITWADVPQMIVIMCALILALTVAINLLPPDVSFGDALRLAGAAGKLNPITTTFDWKDRFNIWSGIIGGAFLMLAYFGTDQSQVQRYLTGKSIGQSRLSLLFNAMAKVPMQFLILFIGAMVFVFYLYERPPLMFHPVEAERISTAAALPGIESRYNSAFEQRRNAANRLKDAREESARGAALADFRSAQKGFDAARAEARKLAKEDDRDYVFLTFVTTHLPMGIVGLVLAVIFTAAMSSISGEINSLATVSVIDVYRRHINRDGTDRHYLMASRIATAFWGVFATAFASYAQNIGSLIVAVNQVGSLFYGGMLGVFVLAFGFKRVGGDAAFTGVIAGELVIFAVARYTSVTFLWFNVIGCLVVIGVALLFPRRNHLAANERV
ncbi:MAG TPA: sodium:solute symporter [Bryobacteraceae bacterium]|nr:sodium:solute symporter [Bryobacteraceae bacterium]